eukprot:CAMPEP_0172912378 /NCGR_PEP_ID=MMETSP1075-20121228/188291_1 /TAXON_ID=2916 /ORGANISM="Ceratium fusus, Strain PA161109" /LENGTH=33 /DNA_ID= /DNA_START= /DNA_END= /DNA_ORIENTATION=
MVYLCTIATATVHEFISGILPEAAKEASKSNTH